MQPLQYDLQSSAAKDDNITHAAAAPSNLDAAITMRFAASRRKPARIYTHNNTRTPNDNSHAAIPVRSATGDSKTPYNYAHTSTPKAAWSHRYNAAKKRQTDRSRTRRTHEVPFIVACSHFTRKNTTFRAPASSPRHSPCNIMQPFQCDLQAQIPKHPITTHTQAHPKQLEATVTMRQKKKANRPQPHPPHRRGTFHRRLQPLYTEKHKVSCSGFLPKTKPLQHHAAIPMRSASTDSKTPYNYAHTSTPKAAWSHRYTAAKKKRQTDRSRTRRTDEVPFLAGCSHFTQKNTRFRAPASSPKQSPCNIMQPFQCDLQAQIPKHPITTHTQAHPKQLEATVTMRQKKKSNRPQPHPPHRRGTFHRRLQPLYTEKHKVSCSGFLPKTEPLQHHAAIPMRSASTDSKTPYNYAHTSTPKAAWSHRYTAAKKKGKPTAAAPAAQTRYLSSPAAATLHGKTQGFVLRLPPQNRALATSCSHSNAICKHRFQNTL